MTEQEYGSTVRKIRTRIDDGSAEELQRAEAELEKLRRVFPRILEALLDALPVCDFSIVIPVRNAVDTLRHTLQTCLAQDYTGSYEIVLSDNSDD